MPTKRRKTSAKKIPAKKRIVKKSIPKKQAVKKLSLRARLKLHIASKKKKPIAPPPIARADRDFLRKHDANPILEPRPTNYWEMKATFNPAAIYADRRVHLLYRAIGGDDISVLGYAASSDGINITERDNDPAFVPTVKKKTPEEEAAMKAVEPPPYLSGGGWNGGCEDPRLSHIEDHVYLMYTAFDGWGSIRIALASIGVQDFLNREWAKWKNPMLLSPPGEVHKNWILFPEKINGRFAILHSISPEILIEYISDLDDFAKDTVFIKSEYRRVSGLKSWDSWIRGAGPPPIKTNEGWLLFYHAMDMRDPNRYKLGAMILDLNDPTKILYRSKSPILEPEEWYENTGWKSGVVYSCGAVVKDGQLYVYYGGADSVVCVAMANLNDFVQHLKKEGTAKLTYAKDNSVKG